MPTYVFEGFTEADLLNASTGSSISQGDVFTMPSETTTQFAIWDNDSSLSGDSNDNATDKSGQTATIKVDGATVVSGKQAYVEVYHIVRDQNGNTYYLIEIEVENHDAVGSGDDYFTFWGDTPPAGATLTVVCTKDTCGISYCDLGTEIPELPVLPGSIGGRLTYDDDANDSEWNAQTGTWDRGVANATVQLIGANGQVVATTTTDSNGTYKFENVAPGEYKVKFPGQTGFEFSAQNVGSDDGSDSDADASGLTMSYTVGSNQHIWNVDAGLKTSLDALDDAITVYESETSGDTDGNVLTNDIVPAASTTTVIAINGIDAAVGAWVELGGGGRVRANSDGTFDFDADDDFDFLNDGESAQVGFTYTIRSTVATSAELVVNFTDPATGLDAVARISELNGDLVITVEVLTDGGAIGDLRGLFFDVSNEALLGGLSVSGSGVTGSLFSANSVVDLGGGATMSGDVVNALGAFDAGVLLGTQGIGKDDLRSVTFVLSHGSEALTLDLLRGEDFGLRLTSVGTDGSGRGDSLKLGGEAVGATGAMLLDTANVTVTVLGEGGVIDAIDDSFRVGETEGVSQANLITGAYLAAEGGDDNPQGDTIDGVVATDADLLASIRLTNVEIGGGYDGSGNATGFTDPDANVGGGTFTVTTSGGRTGEITVGADGAFTFTLVPGDADPEFIEGQTDSVQLRYTVERVLTPASTETQVLDFALLPAGTFVSSQYDGVTVTAVRASGAGGNQAMVFNSEAPTGGDTDLAAPGQGGVLIISENGSSSNPDDNAGGGTFTFTFAEPRTVESLTFLDTEEPTPVLRFYDASGALITTMNGPVTTDGGLAKDFPIGVDGVARMEVVLAGSGALDDLRLTRDIPAEVITDTAIVTVEIDGEGNPDLKPLARDDAASIGEVDTASISILANDDQGDAPYTVKSITYTDAAGAAQFAVVGAGGVTVTAQGTATVNGAAATVTGLLTVGDDGALTFVLDEASKTLLEDGETATLTLSYTGEDVDGDTSSATVTVTIAGDDLQPQAEDNAYLTNEDTVVTGNLITDLSPPDDSGVRAVDQGGDGGVAALTVVSINVGGMDYNVPAGGSVTVLNVASDSGSYTGTLTVHSDGSMSFEPTGFGAMNSADYPETVNFKYTIKDADDDLSTADVAITVSGLDDNSQSLLVKGVVNGQQDIVFLLEFTQQTLDADDALDETVFNVNGDASINSIVDDMLSNVIDVARDLVNAGRAGQTLSLIAFASTALPPFVKTAGEIAAAFGVSGYTLQEGFDNPFFDFGRFENGFQMFDDAALIDIDAALAVANDLITDPTANNKVYLIGTNEDFLEDGLDGSNDFVGDPVLSELHSKADVDAVFYYVSSASVGGDPVATAAIYNAIDEDGIAGLVSQVVPIGLEANPQSTDLSELIDTPLLPNDPALADIALIEITAGGVTQSASFGPGANTAQVSVGGVTFPGLGADAEVDVKITFTDGSTQDFDNVRDYDDSNDTFDFNLSLL